MNAVIRICTQVCILNLSLKTEVNLVHAQYLSPFIVCFVMSSSLLALVLARLIRVSAVSSTNPLPPSVRLLRLSAHVWLVLPLFPSSPPWRSLFINFDNARLSLMSLSADRLGILNHRSLWTLILLNQGELPTTYKLLITVNFGHVDLLSQYKLFKLKLCTDYSSFMYNIYLCTLSIPPALNLLFLSWRMLISQ